MVDTFDELYANTRDMTALSDAMQRFHHAIEDLRRDYHAATRAVDTSMPGCSRYEEVCREVKQALRDAEDLDERLREIREDLLERTEFIAFLEGRETNAWRDDRI